MGIMDVFTRDKSKMRPIEELAINKFAPSSIVDWYKVYENRASWVDRNAVMSLNLAKGIVKEVSNSVIAEFDYSFSSDASFYEQMLKDFKNNESKILKALLVGGRVLSKPYIKNGIVGFTTVSALDYRSTYDDNNDLKFVVIQSKYSQDGKYYTLSEEHEYYKVTQMYTIKYFLFSSDSVNNLGTPVVLSELKELVGIDPVIEIANVPKHLCSEAIIGSAIFGDALELIRDADKQYSRMLWEFEAGEMAIDVSADLLKKSGSSNINSTYEMPVGKERLYRKMVGANAEFGMQHWAPQLRDESYARGLDKILRRIEFACGLAYGTLSESSDTEKTATEILASKQRFYITVTTIQTLLKDFIISTVESVSILVTLLEPAFVDTSIEVSFTVGDSILTDRQEQIDEKLKMMNAGILTLDEVKEWYSKM